MRVIAGSARRLLLKTPKGLETRPTSDQIKETLFNILMPYLYDANFLDLFSGSGGIGIEALSRGCKSAVTYMSPYRLALLKMEAGGSSSHAPAFRVPLDAGQDGAVAPDDHAP